MADPQHHQSLKEPQWLVRLHIAHNYLQNLGCITSWWLFFIFLGAHGQPANVSTACMLQSSSSELCTSLSYILKFLFSGHDHQKVSQPQPPNPFEPWTFNFTVQVNIKQMPILANRDQLFFYEHESHSARCYNIRAAHFLLPKSLIFATPHCQETPSIILTLCPMTAPL